MRFLFHLSDVSSFQIDLSPPSLQAEGFVHLSAAHQVLGTLNRWFSHTDSVKLVVLRTDRLGESLKWEDTHGHGDDFPHLYAPIPSEAIEAIVCMERETDGQFTWPEPLNSMLSPLLETLTEEVALIEPTRRFPEKKLPQLCVLCFFQEVLDSLEARPDCQVHEGLGSEIGAKRVLVFQHKEVEVAVCHPGVGGPLAAATLEELIALGCQIFVVCGGAGSLVPEQTMGQLVAVDKAWRDEGVSHHYLPPGPSLDVDRAALASMRKTLDGLKVNYKTGATWTTDALYRETPSRIQLRKESGCLTVEMELASLLAVSQYRGAKLAALVYCGDDVGSESWDFRDWTSAQSVRERLFWLGMEVVVAL